MSRRVPEFAVITGVFLGLSVVVSGAVLGWSLYATVVVTAVVSYPFVAFGIIRDDDPAATIRPRWLLAAGSVIAAGGALGVLLDDATPRGVLFALLVGGLLAAPATGYATRYEANVNPLSARITVVAGGLLGIGLVGTGVLLDAPYVGTGAGVVFGLGSALYGTARGVTFDARTKRLAAGAGGVLGVCVVGFGALQGGSLTPWLLVGTSVAVVPSLYVALTSDVDRRSSRVR
ncbi:hypothetical protein [Halobellus clavatus]|jgi:hypothetical protein|uniref:Uncharacterized protein n=1 Tax=Halobellus clavatus TaxID=660517 RepID=A0A1H3GAX7_9EURY|nr:hypothetical protein [Halobellus clavatus]SDY00483.1 hypothetical protein SAMN04487946_10574 [Halobellus clavatus]